MVIGIGNAVHTVVKYRKLLAQKLAAVTVSHDEIDDLLNYGAILGIRGVPIEVFKNYLLYDDATELAPVPKKICEALKILSTPASVAIPYYCTWERSGTYIIKYAVCGEPLARAVAAGHGVEEARDQLILQVLDSYYHCIYHSLTIILDAVLYSFVFWWIEMLNPVYTFVQTTMLRRNQP